MNQEDLPKTSLKISSLPDTIQKKLPETIPLLLTELKECNSQQRLRYFQNRFEKYDLVIADGLGYISFDREGTDLLFSNLSLRAGRKSVIVTSNLTFVRWTEVFGDPAIINAWWID
jgi:DNA replication protein DnaC